MMMPNAETLAKWAETIAAQDDMQLYALSCQARNEANDLAYDDTHRLARFALHLAVEAERDRRAAEAMHAHDEWLAALSPEELAAHEAEAVRNTHLLPLG